MFSFPFSVPSWTINGENWNSLDTWLSMINTQLPYGNLIKMFDYLISLIKNPNIFKDAGKKHGCYKEGNLRPALKFKSTDIQYVPEQSRLRGNREPSSLSCFWQERVSTREVEGSTIRWDANERIIIRDEITELYPQYLLSLALTLMLPFMLVFYTSSS